LVVFAITDKENNISTAYGAQLLSGERQGLVEERIAPDILWKDVLYLRAAAWVLAHSLFISSWVIGPFAPCVRFGGEPDRQDLQRITSAEIWEEHCWPNSALNSNSAAIPPRLCCRRTRPIKEGDNVDLRAVAQVNGLVVGGVAATGAECQGDRQ
jgi:hypothetical protein